MVNECPAHSLVVSHEMPLQVHFKSNFPNTKETWHNCRNRCSNGIWSFCVCRDKVVDHAKRPTNRKILFHVFFSAKKADKTICICRVPLILLCIRISQIDDNSVGWLVPRHKTQQHSSVITKRRRSKKKVPFHNFHTKWMMAFCLGAMRKGQFSAGLALNSCTMVSAECCAVSLLAN